MINNRNYLKITVQDERTTLEYLEEGDILFSHIYNIGHKSIEDDNWSVSMGNNWMSYILWMLHSISYTTRIPNNFILISDNNIHFFKNILDIHRYNDFFLENNKIYVIIQNIENINYERYKKTIYKFKI